MAMRGTRLSRLSALAALLPLCAQAGPAPAPTDRTAALGEVVVTARKIEEDLQDVPMSVQVVSGDYLDGSRTTRLHELQFAVPGLVVNNIGMFGVGVAMRGVSEQGVGGRSVASHVNGVHLVGANLAVARMFDVERIEVLKGPQGTLYGADATGGTMNVITRVPGGSRSAEIEASFGSFETTRVQGHADIPMREAALRLAFIASEGDGFIRNTVDDRRFSEEDYWGLRASLRIDAGESLGVDLMMQHLRDDGGSGDLWLPSPTFMPDPRHIRLTTVTHVDPYLVSESDIASLNLESELGFATLRSTSGYARSEVRNVDDCAGLPFLVNCVRSILPNRSDQWSQELQLAFPRSGALEGIVGALHLEYDGTQRFHQLLPLVNAQPLNNNHNESRESVSAVFGQATIHFGGRWAATGGLRMSWQERRLAHVGTGFQDSKTPLIGSVRADNLSWLFDLGYHLSDDHLWYARIATGFESGGFSTTTIIDGKPDTYDAEYLTSFELGAKSRWLSGRLALNAVAFLADYEDLQVSTSRFVGTILFVGVDNAAKAEVYGIDADLSFEISDRWSVGGGLVWVPKREFVEYINDVTGDTLSGNKLVRAPEWSAVAAVSWSRPLWELGRLSARLEYSYRSRFYYTPENDARYSQDDFGLLNAQLRFEAADAGWYAFASGHNLTDEDYFHQVFFQSSPGLPSTWEVGVGVRF